MAATGLHRAVLLALFSGAVFITICAMKSSRDPQTPDQRTVSERLSAALGLDPRFDAEAFTTGELRVEVKKSRGGGELQADGTFTDPDH